MTVLSLAAGMLSVGTGLLLVGIIAVVLGIVAAVIAATVRNAKWNRWLEAALRTPQRYSVGTLQNIEDYEKNVAAYGKISQRDAEQIAETLYQDLTRARQLQNLSNVRIGLTQDCYDEWNALIQTDRDANRTHFERTVSPPVVQIAGWVHLDRYDYDDIGRPDPQLRAYACGIVLQIMVRAREYDIDTQSSRVVSGSGQQETFLMYECMLMQRDRNRTNTGRPMPPAGDRLDWEAAVFRRMTPQISDHRFVR